MDYPETSVDLLHAEFRVLRRLNSITQAPIRLLNTIESNLRPNKGEHVSMIDFGAGIVDIARAAIRESKKRGWNLSTLATDQNPNVVKMCQESGSTDGMSFQQSRQRHQHSPSIRGSVSASKSCTQTSFQFQTTANQLQILDESHPRKLQIYLNDLLNCLQHLLSRN